ncbi:MAG: hypothetical protein WCI74_11055 [Actinomycetes bacterium]
MPRSFGIVSESAASVEEIHAAFRRENYWLDWLAGDAASLTNSLPATLHYTTTWIAEHA